MLCLMQIWILPERKGLTPGYEQKYFAPEEKRGKLRLVASRDGREDSVTIHQDACVFAGAPAPGEEIIHTLPAGRRAWIQVVRGRLRLNGNPLKQGDGAAVGVEKSLRITGEDDGEALLFDLA
jgi:hypothetical protein